MEIQSDNPEQDQKSSAVTGYQPFVQQGERDAHAFVGDRILLLDAAGDDVHLGLRLGERDAGF